MQNLFKTMIGAMGFALVMLAFHGGVATAAFPERPVTMLVGFGAGGGTDIVARKIGIELEKALGQPVVVVNKPGGGGLVSWKELAVAKPDGYTMAIFLPLNAAIQKHLDTSKAWIDPLTDIRLLGMVNEDAWGIAVKADAPYDDLKGFVEWVKANPGAKVSDGGPATAYHWAWEAFMDRFGVKLRTVTYQGATAAGLQAVAGGEVVAAGAGAPEADSMVSAGLIKMLGISAEQRLDAAPDIPTFKEQGFDFVFGPTRGFAVPAGTPDDIVKILETAIKKAYESDSFQAHLKSSGQGGFYLSAENGAAYLKEVDDQFRSLIDKAGMLRK